MKNGNLPAMPCLDMDVMQQCKIAESNNVLDVAKAMSGLTKREYFAAMAMQGILSSKFVTDFSTKPQSEMPDGVAEASVDYADALLKALGEE